jgi:hypothetical protein
MQDVLPALTWTLATLTCLTDLAVFVHDADTALWDAMAALTVLTRLDIAYLARPPFVGTTVPIVLCHRLRHLTVRVWSNDEEWLAGDPGLAVSLRELSTLTSLKIQIEQDWAAVADALAAPGGPCRSLARLVLSCLPQSAAASIGAALRSLTALTELNINQGESFEDILPFVAASLPSCQKLKRLPCGGGASDASGRFLGAALPRLAHLSFLHIQEGHSDAGGASALAAGLQACGAALRSAQLQWTSAAASHCAIPCPMFSSR